ncbi:MAG: transposase [Pedobacter sp.]|nr:MAG: transposase [Pedobacter sp.]
MILQSRFLCTSCSNTSNADVNAAKNILSRGVLLAMVNVRH